MFKLNPTVLLVILIGIGFQTAFSQSITLNIIVAVVGLLYLLLQRVSGKVIVIMLLVAVPLAFGTWWSFIAFGTGDTHRIALVYASRLYAYLLLGAALTLTTHVKDLLISLHLHAKLSSTFTYGLLVAFNLLPRVRRQVQTMQRLLPKTLDPDAKSLPWVKGQNAFMPITCYTDGPTTWVNTAFLTAIETQGFQTRLVMDGAPDIVTSKGRNKFIKQLTAIKIMSL